MPIFCPNGPSIFFQHDLPRNLSESLSQPKAIVNFFTDIHQGVGWLGVGERYYFSLHEIFRTAHPFLGTNVSQIWREFFLREIKRGCEENRLILIAGLAG